MDYLQYQKLPCLSGWLGRNVLNLIINGLPSIQSGDKWQVAFEPDVSFKPYYKWITFNTLKYQNHIKKHILTVLNLIINGLPSILIPLIIFKKTRV